MKNTGLMMMVLSMIVFAGCNVMNSEPELSDKLVGEWEDILYEYEGVKVVHIYRFLDIDTYESFESHYDAEGAFLGYRFYDEGSYNLTGDKLVMDATQVYYVAGDTLYPNIEELKMAGETYDSSKADFRTEFDNSNRRVTLYFECPPNALCVEPPVLEKLGPS